jgi:hypothetical protein
VLVDNLGHLLQLQQLLLQLEHPKDHKFLLLQLEHQKDQELKLQTNQPLKSLTDLSNDNRLKFKELLYL